MAKAWRKIIVSGSRADLLDVTASFFKGDGSSITNLQVSNIPNLDNQIKTKLNTENVHSGSYLGTATTANLPENTNLYYTDTRVKTKLNTENVVSGSVVRSVTGGNGIAQGGTATDPTLSISSHSGTAGSVGTIVVGANTVGVSLGSTSTTAAPGNHTHSSFNNSSTLSGASVYSKVSVTNGIVTGLTTRNLTASDIGAVADGGGASNQVAYWSNGTTITSNTTLQFNGSALSVGTINPSSTVGRIDASNDIVAFSTSDIRLKSDIKIITSALSKVSRLRGVSFIWKKDLKKYHGYEGKDIGLLAQEVEQVLPQAVRENDNEYKAIRYEKIIPLLVEAIKELKKEIESLK